jgi:hypothetical protein
VSDLIAEIKSTAAWHHDVQKKKQRSIASCFFGHACDTGESADDVSACFEVMSQQPRNIWIVFYYKDRLFHWPHCLVREP